jgi:hypothetical protein
MLGGGGRPLRFHIGEKVLNRELQRDYKAYSPDEYPKKRNDSEATCLSVTGTTGRDRRLPPRNSKPAFP